MMLLRLLIRCVHIIDLHFHTHLPLSYHLTDNNCKIYLHRFNGFQRLAKTVSIHSLNLVETGVSLVNARGEFQSLSFMTGRLVVPKFFLMRTPWTTYKK